MRAALLLLMALQTVAPQRTGHLFPPENLGLLESPDRAAWQKPDQIMDALGIADGSKVADIGPGAGWFTIQLARRVGPNGVIYAEDIQRQMLEAIRRRVSREGLQNVQTVMGTAAEPNLPRGALDAILMVDVYGELEQPVTFLRNLALALKPNGRIGIVNRRSFPSFVSNSFQFFIDLVTVTDITVWIISALLAIGIGLSKYTKWKTRDKLVRALAADAPAAGLRVVARENLPFQYLLVLGK